MNKRKQARVERAKERIENAKPKDPKSYGLKEKVKHGVITVDEAIKSLGDQGGESIINWLRRKLGEEINSGSQSQARKKVRQKNKKVRRKKG